MNASQSVSNTIPIIASIKGRIRTELLKPDLRSSYACWSSQLTLPCKCIKWLPVLYTVDISLVFAFIATIERHFPAHARPPAEPLTGRRAERTFEDSLAPQQSCGSPSEGGWARSTRASTTRRCGRGDTMGDMSSTGSTNSI